MLEQHLRDWLITDAQLAPEIGERVYPQFVPEAADLPAIAYAFISDQATLSLDGVASNRQPRVQLSIMAERQMDVSRIAELIKKRINAWEAEYADMVVGSNFCEGGVYLSLEYYNPPRSGMMVEAFLNWKPV